MTNVSSNIFRKITHFGSRQGSRDTGSDPAIHGISRRLGQIALVPALIATPEVAEAVYMRVTLIPRDRPRAARGDTLQQRTEGKFSLLLSLPAEIQLEIIDINEEERSRQPKDAREGNHPLLMLRM